MQASEVLVNARQAIETKGWIQHNERTHKGVCMVGALVDGAGLRGSPAAYYRTRGAYATACYFVARVLSAEAEPIAIAVWNDDPFRTVTDVLDVLTHAEKLAKEREDADQ